MKINQLKQKLAVVLSVVLLLNPSLAVADSLEESVLFLPEAGYSACCVRDASSSDASMNTIFGDENASYFVQEEDFVSGGTLETDFVAPRIESDEDSDLLKSSSLPEKYNAMEEGYVTPIKNQLSGTQTCWAFQYTQCMESDLLHDGNFKEELAPLGTAYFHYYLPADPLGLTGDATANQLTLPSIANYYMVGGNSIYTMMSQSGWIGLTDEESIPYTAENLERDDYNYADYSFDYIQTGAYIYNKADIDLVKQGILEHGSAGVDLSSYIFSATYGTMHYHLSHTDDSKLDAYAFCTPSTVSKLKKTNHSMQIIGWDDTIDKEYFRNRNGTCPENDGGWLIRNTEGSEWPYSDVAHPGCVWVSYEDFTIGKNIYLFDAEPASDYLHNYHYDGNGSNHKTSAKAAACLYQAVETELLTHVNVGFADANVKYTVEIYLSSDKPDTPTSGILAYRQENNQTVSAGLYTVELDEPVLLAGGQWFSIVIRTEQNTNFYTEAEQTAKYLIFVVIRMIADLGETEGWLSLDGENFVDASGEDYLCCPRIKGFTRTYVPKPSDDDDDDDPPVKKETYSKNWFMTDGVWQFRGKDGEPVRNSWVCDNAVASNGTSVWYFMDKEGKLLVAELATDSDGNFYSFENQHNGYYGSMRIQDGSYTVAGKQIYLQFSHVHDGSYGKIINREAIDLLKQMLSEDTPLIPSESELIYTSELQ